MALIEVEKLTKNFKHQIREKGFYNNFKSLFNRKFEIKKAINDISFKIEKGELIGFIGPNGAGKSTTIKILVGILVPSSGAVNVNGLIPYKNRLENAKKIGVVFGQRTQLWWDIPVSESFILTKYMYKIPDKKYNENINLFSEILGIDKFINLPVRQLSLGQKMRADLCAALLHDPEIIYLDEPTLGLDVVAKKNIREFINEINKRRNTTIILTTHDMVDIEKLSSRVIVIDHGKIIHDGNLEYLKNKYGNDEILSLELEEQEPDLNRLYKFGVVEIKKEKNKILLRYDKNKINSTKIIKFIMKNYRIKDFIVYGTEIDEIIRKIYLNKTI